MRDDLLYYYERELSFLRDMGAEFGRKYPKVASRLALEPAKCDDPHVERLLEGFALLAARVHLRVDDDLSEISESLLSVIYPHYLRPVPSMSLVQFHLDPDQGRLISGLSIPKDSVLYSRPINEIPYRFRTSYDTTLWPLEIEEVSWTTPDRLDPPINTSGAAGAVKLRLRCFPDVKFSDLELETLRLHLSGDSGLIATLYELLLNDCTRVIVREPGSRAAAVVLPGSALKPAGFGKDEGVIPYPRRSFYGYRILQEYFSFPEKFNFVDLSGLERLRGAGFGERADVIFLIDSFERAERREQLETGMKSDTFRLGCTPVINLFPQTSEPIRLTECTHEYPIVPDARRRESTAIYSVDEVLGNAPGSSEVSRFEQFFSYRHAGANGSRLFWHAKRRPSAWRLDEGSDVFLSFVDLSGRAARPDLEVVSARLTCFNGDLPNRLPFGGSDGDFELHGGGPIAKIVTLVKPTAVIQPALGKPLLWRLISQLSLNYLSLAKGGPDALQELLRLHNFGDSPAGEKQIQGIVGLEGSACYSRIDSEHGLTFARGHRVDIELDEENFTGGSAFLFASALERFLGLYVSLNSFTILAARTRQRKEILREWSPRAGWKSLL